MLNELYSVISPIYSEHIKLDTLGPAPNCRYGSAEDPSSYLHANACILGHTEAFRHLIIETPTIMPIL